MPDFVRITRVDESRSTGVEACGRPRSVPGNRFEDTLQISREAYEKSREYMMRLKNDASSDQSSSQPQVGNSLEILSLPPDATKDQIRRAYLGAIKLYHPDKFAGLCSEFRSLAEEKSKQINMAYENLIKV